MNPAFSGMLLCELNQEHLVNEFPVNKYYELKNGIIVHHGKAYVFTSIRNDDIQSHLKILLRRKRMKHNITPASAATMLRKFVRHQSQETIIPSIRLIQDSLFNILGLTENSYSDDHITYFILLHRIYLLIFMLRYNMPVQRCRPPGERNSAESIRAIRKKGWYSSLKPLEQNILQSSDIELSYFLIPEDSINGVYPFRDMNYKKISFVDIQNSKMYRDGTMDNTKFQYMIMKFQTKYAVKKHPLNSTPKHKSSEPIHSEVIPSNKKRLIETMTEVPTIQDLQQRIELYKTQTDVVSLKTVSSTIQPTWNEMFHSIISNCSLTNHFPSEKLPGCYAEGLSCSHIFHVDLDKIVSNTIQLTLLEQAKHRDNQHQTSLINVTSFISKVIKGNPIWDLGLQFSTICANYNRIYTNIKGSAETFTKCCVCPCSQIFRKWHKLMSINTLPDFKECNSSVYSDPMDFIIHLDSCKDEYYHRIIMRIVQNLYSSLLAKFTTVENKSSKKTFHSVHGGTVSLPSYQNTGAKYSIFELTR